VQDLPDRLQCHIVRRVAKDDIRLRRRLTGQPTVDSSLMAGGPWKVHNGDVLPDDLTSRTIVFDEMNPGSTARERLKTHGTRAREQIKDRDAIEAAQHRLQRREDRFPCTVRSWSGTAHWNVQPSPLCDACNYARQCSTCLRMQVMPSPCTRNDPQRSHATRRDAMPASTLGRGRTQPGPSRHHELG